MSDRMKTTIKNLLIGAAVVAAAVTAVAGFLIYPGTPSDASSLIFRGYVPLPSATLLSVLDYLTVNDDELFVANESTGDVYRVHIRKDALPTAAARADLGSGMSPRLASLTGRIFAVTRCTHGTVSNTSIAPS